MFIIETERYSLKTMKDKEQLNYSIKEHMKKLKKHSDSKKIMMFFQMLSQYSIKFCGMSWKRNKLWAKDMGVSVRTIQRWIKTLSALNIIIVFPTYRENKRGQASNTICILPVLKRVCHGVCRPLKPSINPEELNNNHLNNKRSQYIKFVPKSLQHFQAFFGKGIKDIYSRCWLAVKKLNINDYVDQSDMQEIGHIVFNQLKEYMEKGKALTTEERCKLAYKITINQLEECFDIERIRFDQYVRENNLPYYDWVNQEEGEQHV